MKSGAECVWESGVIHTLLIPAHSSAPHRASGTGLRGGLCAEPSRVFVSESLKRKKDLLRINSCTFHPFSV